MPGSACLVVVDRGRTVGRSDGRTVGRSDGRIIGNLGYPFAIAKIANSPLMFGNLGYPFAIAKIAQKESRNKKNGCWRGVVASLIGAKVLAILAILSCKNNRYWVT